MVPFRLTQNVIDGFGITGVEGVFRRCSETTLQVSALHCAHCYHWVLRWLESVPDR